MRYLFATTSMLLGGAFLAGCAATSEPRQPFATRSLWKSPATVKKDAEREQKETKTAASSSEEPATKSDNPFRKASSAGKEKTSATAAEIAATTTAKPPSKDKPAEANADEKSAAAGESKAAAAFHPETLKVIDDELADASAEERAYWYDQLKRVDPAVIPQILQARRLTAQIVEQREKDPSATDSKSAARTDRMPDVSRKLAQRGDWTQDESAVVNAVGRQFPGSAADLNQALHQTDGMSVQNQIVQQGYEVPSPQPRQPAYAAQRIGTPPPAAQAPPTGTASPTTTRNGLSRFLPSTRNNAIAQASANSPSAISLLPPAELEPPPATEAQLASLISLVEADVAQLRPAAGAEAQTEYIRRHVYLRMLYLMAQHPERALTAIPGIDSADQEFWQQTLWAMTNYFDVEHLPAAKDRAGQAVAQLATATLRLRERSDLEIRNLAFCRQIETYGNFVRIPRDEFSPGADALLYAEIENFKSELTVDGQYRTLLRSTVEILSPSGEVRDHKDFPATEDLCVNYRRDYFHSYQFTIPDRLPLGPHVLKLTVFDELSNRVVSQSVNFVVR